MSSQPIVVPSGDHRSHTEAHSVPVGGSSDTFKAMTPPNVSRSFSREYIIILHVLFNFSMYVSLGIYS